MNDERIDFKAFASLLCQKHMEKGGAAVCLDADLTDAFYAVHCGCRLENLTPEDGVVRFPGKLLSARKVRTWLWNNRKDPRLGDYTSVVWSLYDTETDSSVLGIAKIHAPAREVASAPPVPN